MSTSYSSYVICGFELSIKPNYEDITKYDEDNGKPYNIKREISESAFIEEKMIMESDEDQYLGDEIEGLEVVYGGYEDSHRYLGISLSDLNDYSEAANELSFDVPDEVKKFAKKFGVAPKFFHVFNIS